MSLFLHIINSFKFINLSRKEKIQEEISCICKKIEYKISSNFQTSQFATIIKTKLRKARSMFGIQAETGTEYKLRG